MKLLIFLTLLFSLEFISTQDVLTVGSTDYLIFGRPSTYAFAQNYCRRQNAILAVINDMNVYNKLVTTIRGSSGKKLFIKKLI